MPTRPQLLLAVYPALLIQALRMDVWTNRQTGEKKQSFYFASATEKDEEQVMWGHNIVADG